MAFTREYQQKLIFSLDTVRRASQAQQAMRDHAIITQASEGYLGNLLLAAGGTTSILGLVFKINAAVTLAFTVLGLVGEMISNEKEILENLVNEGLIGLGQIEDFLVNNSNYDLVEVNLPVLEYETEGVRFVKVIGAVTRVHGSSGWTLL